jgi:hypothetical protein
MQKNSCGCQSEVSGEHCLDGVWYYYISGTEEVNGVEEPSGSLVVSISLGKVMAVGASSTQDAVNSIATWYFSYEYPGLTYVGNTNKGQPAGTTVLNPMPQAKNCQWEQSTYIDKCYNFFGTCPFIGPEDYASCGSDYAWPQYPYGQN